MRWQRFCLDRHLDSAGTGICWVAVRGGDLLGFVLCGSDGVCGHVLDMAAPHDQESAGLALLEQCRDACFSRSWLATQLGLIGAWAHGQFVYLSLRGLDVRAVAPSDGEATVFEKLGWQALPKVFSCERPESVLQLLSAPYSWTFPPTCLCVLVSRAAKKSRKSEAK
eukprot:2741327-Amphidinium_carterae.1